MVKYEGDVKSLKQWKGGLVERCEKAKEECEALLLVPPDWSPRLCRCPLRTMLGYLKVYTVSGGGRGVCAAITIHHYESRGAA